MKFTFTRLDIPEILLIECEIFKDARGFLLESYRHNDFAGHGIPLFIQDNHSRSTTGVLRGLHYQKEPAALGKLVRCVRGSILDITVDIRKGSPTYGRYVAVILGEDTNSMLYVPPGFAHGFLTVSDVADVTYKTTGYYSPAHDRCIRWNDPDIAIAWPIRNPRISEKDARAPRLKDADNNFVY